MVSTIFNLLNNWCAKKYVLTLRSINLIHTVYMLILVVWGARARACVVRKSWLFSGGVDHGLNI